MRKSAFTIEEVVVILKQSEQDVGQQFEFVTRHGISEPTLRRWRLLYGGLDVEQATKLAALANENSRVRRAIAELQTANQALTLIVWQ